MILPQCRILANSRSMAGRKKNVLHVQDLLLSQSLFGSVTALIVPHVRCHYVPACGAHRAGVGLTRIPSGIGFCSICATPPLSHSYARIVKAKGEERQRCGRWCRKWSAVAFSTDLGLRSRSEVGRRFGEGHSAELSSNGTKLVVTRRGRTWRTAPGAMAGWPPPRCGDPGGGELGSDRTGL